MIWKYTTYSKSCDVTDIEKNEQFKLMLVKNNSDMDLRLKAKYYNIIIPII